MHGASEAVGSCKKKEESIYGRKQKKKLLDEEGLKSVCDNDKKGGDEIGKGQSNRYG